MKNQNLSRAMMGNRNAAGARSGRQQRALLIQRAKLERQQLTLQVQQSRLAVDTDLEDIRRQRAERRENWNRFTSASLSEQLQLAVRRLRQRISGR